MNNLKLKEDECYMLRRANVASIDVDAQKGFSGLCPKELPVDGAVNIVPELNAQAEFAFKRIGTKDAHPALPFWLATFEHPVLSRLGMHDADVYWPSHCVNGTTGGESLPGLPNPECYDFFVWKGMEPHLHPYGACYHDLHDKLSTGLIEYLRANCITHVVVGGLATDYCVATTCRQLLKNEIGVFLNLGASRAISEEGKIKAIYDLHVEYGMNFITINKAEDLREFIDVPKSK